MAEETSPKRPPEEQRSRFRDFIILTIGGVAILGLLFVTNAIGLVEWITGSVVMLAGALAYYVGSTPSPTVRPADSMITPAEVEQAEPASVQVEPFIDSMPFAALLINKDGRIVTANDYACRIFRITEPKNALAEAALRQPDLLAAYARISLNGASERVEFALHGESETWMAHMQAGSEPGSVMIVLEDMTAVRRAERARADFLANASHELRTPLTAIGGFIETMRGPAREDKASWDGFLDIMQQQTERMKRLVSDLLSLSRIEFSEHRAPDTRIEVVSLVRETSLSLQTIAKNANVQLQVDTPDHDIETIADADEILQVVQNLASNALKYAAQGGTVHIAIGIAPTMSEAALASSRQMPDAKRAMLLDPRASSEVSALWIRISDDGEGIPEQHLPRLGERFYRADESRGGVIEGTGLGLAIVKHIMARHRGGLAVESHVGKGTAFGVWMPRLET